VIPSFGNSLPVRIFITRSKSRLRYIENEAEIIGICRTNNFLIIDNDMLTYEDQVRMFQEASVIVGIHGAGLTNMFFRNDDCKVLEIFPSLAIGYLPFHYIMLAKMKGFKYHAIIGREEEHNMSGAFHLDPNN